MKFPINTSSGYGEIIGRTLLDVAFCLMLYAIISAFFEVGKGTDIFTTVFIGSIIVSSLLTLWALITGIFGIFEGEIRKKGK